MKTKRGPCCGCEKRKIACHGACEAYKAWSAEQEAIHEDLRKKKGECYISKESMKKHWRNLRMQNRKYVKK